MHKRQHRNRIIFDVLGQVVRFTRRLKYTFDKSKEMNGRGAEVRGEGVGEKKRMSQLVLSI